MAASGSFPQLLARALIGAVLVAIAASVVAAEPISIGTQPIESFDNRDPSRTRFGSLEFRGGLVLMSTDKAFGGLSAMRVASDGQHFLSLTDHANWFRGRLVHRDGRLAGLAATELIPMLGADGKPLATEGRVDTESLAVVDGKYCVGVERTNRILCFDYQKDNVLARAKPIAVPDVLKTLPRNKGLEAMVGIPAGQELAGALIAIAEDVPDASGDHTAVMIGGPRAGQFGIARSGGYDVTDAALLPGGDIVILERHFSLARGAAMRIRRLSQSAIKPGAIVDGKILIEADLGYQIDNMEGLAVHRAANGETILTLVSDDNFSPLQRTLLLQFALTGE
jgi:hypothetical protein